MDLETESLSLRSLVLVVDSMLVISLIHDLLGLGSVSLALQLWFLILEHHSWSTSSGSSLNLDSWFFGSGS